jgi:hypothetical protein
MGKNAPTYRVFANRDGKFVLKDIPKGRYCFHIACLGWHSYNGTMIVDKKADPGNTLSLGMAREWPMDSGGPTGPMRRAGTFQSPFDICDMEDLSAADHIWDQIDKPFVVRKVKGRILGEGRGMGPEDCEWFADMVPLVELRAMGKGTKVYRVFTDFRGRFSVSNIPEGRYCLNANMYGWNACLCTIIVDLTADSKSEVLINLNLAM